MECKKGCSKENIYTADELQIFYNMTPNAVFTFKGERCDASRDLKIIQWFQCSVFCEHDGTHKNKSFLVFFLLGDSLASEFYEPMFQNALSVPSS